MRPMLDGQTIDKAAVWKPGAEVCCHYLRDLLHCGREDSGGTDSRVDDRVEDIGEEISEDDE